MRRVSFSGAEKTIQAIWDWYQVQSRLSLGKKNELLDALRNSRPVPDSIFFAMGMEEIDEFFRELDYVAMLDLLAATEATIRLNFLTRVYGRKKDEVSRQFRELYKKQGDRVGLELSLIHI